MKQKNRQFFCYKFNSDRLRRFNYDIKTNFNEAKANDEIIALADNQILRTIRDIKKIKFDKEILEGLYKERSQLKQLTNDGENIVKIKNIQSKINHLLFFPEYITVIIEKKGQYDYMFKNGFKVNGVLYKRLSCSAGQARNSTVVFCSCDIIEEVERILNNDRDLTKPIAPSKFNAYFGLYSSATKLVTEPSFTVVADFNNEVDYDCYFDIETNPYDDDIIEQRHITQEIDRMDGMGLISPHMASVWASDLGEYDYTPSQFVVRQSFLKGLLTVFDFHKFCEEKNNGNYLIKTIYKDEDGNSIYEDLRDCDVIISESQFKLWDSYKSKQQYIDSYHRNKIFWGVTQYSPQHYNEVTNLNYQFLQALNLDEYAIQDVCSLFLDWISGVSVDNPYYTLLFLTGRNNTEDRILEYLRSWEIYWIKCLIVNHNIFQDRYIQKKIYQYLNGIIKRACLGEIPILGNFQFLVTDPYAYMQFVCGQEVTGLLKQNEYFSNYWNRRKVDECIGMRSPLTSPSEPIHLYLKNNKEMNEWYKHCYNGVIINWFGNDVVKLAGSDFDGDLIFSSCNKSLINGINNTELPVTYDAPKPKKIIPTKEDLYLSDLFGMGSQIGQITNKGASAVALMPIITKKYGKNSVQYRILQDRIRQTCVLQSKQIDKTKIGKAVKGIPKCWLQKQNSTEEDDDFTIAEKQKFNELLLNKKPYFFRYLYKDSNQEYKQYILKRRVECFKLFNGKDLESILEEQNPTDEEKSFVERFYTFCPLILSDCVVNNICKYIESINKNIKNKINDTNAFYNYNLYKDINIKYTEKQKNSILYEVKKYLSSIRKNVIDEEVIVQELPERLDKICEDKKIIVNIIIDAIYAEGHSKFLDILWKYYGKTIYENVVNNSSSEIKFPFKNKNGDILYLGERYSVERIKNIE